jgi:3-methyladenine DNA glycosylase Tag
LKSSRHAATDAGIAQAVGQVLVQQVIALADRAEMPTESKLPAQTSKDLKKPGFRFCGPAIYAFMEATGIARATRGGCCGPKSANLG